MSVIAIPRPLRERLGEDATDAFVEVIKELEIDSHRGLATKEDIALLKEDITKVIVRIVSVESELKLIKWIMGIMLAGVISLVMKTFIM